LTSKCKGKLPVVWLHSPAKSAWAAVHTVRRHGGRVEHVVVIELTIPRTWLRRSKRVVRSAGATVPPDASMTQDEGRRPFRS
jgi:hypothetical protein